jgi:aminomethyltransferase
MPLEYSGLISEHNAVRTAAGLFDVSHMGEIEVAGPGALRFLQRVTCNDVARLGVGQGQYSALPSAAGCPLDDVILFRLSADRFLLVVNAGNVEKDLRWLQGQGPEDCALVNRADEYALLAIQGPAAEGVLQPLTSLDLPSLRRYHCAEGDVARHPALVARTGYTGEDGFEVFVPPDRATDLWYRLVETGRDKGLVPAGLGARDTLRLEARMCLQGTDMDETTTLVEAGLGWIVCVDPEKGDFNGRGVLEAQKKDGPPRTLVGFEVVGRGIARHGYPVLMGEEQVGVVTSGTYAPFLKKNIGLCYLPAARSAVSTPFDVEVRGHRVAAKVVSTPFYKRPR